MSNSTPEYKLLAYNTSFVNDCCANQFHPGLSESASIIAKYVKTYHIQAAATTADATSAIDDANPTADATSAIDDANPTATGFSEEDTTTDTSNDIYENFIKDLQKEENGVNIGIETYKKQLTKFRLGLADASTKYIKGKLENDYDFIALIEQSMHVPATNHAYYKCKNEMDLTQVNPIENNETNEDYGILKRLNALGNNDIEITDIDEITDGNLKKYGSGSKKYTVVYDNILNTPIVAGEGIAIIYKSDLVKTPFKWNQQENPNNKHVIAGSTDTKASKEMKEASEFETTKLKSKRTISYYSDDLGRYLCHDSSGKLRYVKKDGTADYGRPIIITGGMKDNKMVLFVAVHGPNIMNLYKFVDGTKAEKNNKEIYTTGTLDEKKELDNFYTTFIGTIAKIINDAVEKITEPNPIPLIEKIELFLGGDFNDPTGQLLESLLQDGITITVKGSPDKSFTITFNYNIKPKEKEGGLQGTYKNLLSCCANADSLKLKTKNGEKLQNVDATSFGLLQPMSTDSAKFITRINEIKGYPIGFDIPDNFGYNGDYALFGISSPVYTMKLGYASPDDIEPSDHLPVESIVQPATELEAATPVESNSDTTQGGGKRRSTRKRRKYNKKSRKVKRKRSKRRQ
jgi:hypothetical protein